jgi:hypothetical protein
MKAKVKKPVHKDEKQDKKLIKKIIKKDFENKNKPLPYDKREQEVTKKAMASTKKSVKTVAYDTNKTRRKPVKPTKYGTRSPKAGSPDPKGVDKHGDRGDTRRK